VNRLTNLQTVFNNHFLDSRQNTFPIMVFCKALVLYTIIKIMLLWNVSSNIISLQEFVPSPSLIISTLFFPAQWATEHIFIFYSICIAVLIIILFVRWNHVSGIVFFFLVLNLFRVNVSIANGSDYVLIMLSFWAIGMAFWPILENKKWNTLLILFFNAAVFLCQLQIAFIYLVSGIDKLKSEIWRSGDAISYIAHLDFFYNPNIALPDNHFLNLTLSWITIVFELAFPILIWMKKTRLVMLSIGVIFHLVIWFVLSIPDFGLMMIVSYLIFMKDSDFKRVKGMKLQS